MAFEVKMPQLGLTMEEGTISRWVKQEGDKVAVGDVLLEITTDKLTSEVESEYDGTLIKIIAQEGADIPVKGLLAYIGEAGEVASGTEGKAEEVANKTAEVAKTAEKADSIVATPSVGRIRISPLAKKTAAKMGVAYINVKGTGPGGRIVQKDILSVSTKTAEMIEQKKVTPQVENAVVKTGRSLMDGDEVMPLSGMRKVVAERMTQSRREIPSVTQNVNIDVTDLMKFRKEMNANLGVKYSVNDFIIKAVAKALKNNKHILVSLDGNQIIKRAHVNIGMAVALEGGLIVPVIKDADKMGLEEISATAKDLAEKARSNRLQMDEYKGSTFSISNLGMFGVETFDPIINQPDAGILGICAVQDGLVMDDGGVISKRQFMRISFTFDHRLIDGATAAKFELEIKELLENPMKILL